MGIPYPWLVAAAVAAGPPTPAAEPAPEAAAQAAPRVLVLVPEGDAEERAGFIRAVQAHLASSDVTVERRPIPAHVPRTVAALAAHASAAAAAAGALGAFWIESAEQAVLVYLVEPDGARILVRRLDRPPGTEAAVAESVGVVVRASAEALAAGRRIGMTAVPAPPPAAREVSPSPPPEVSEPPASAPPEVSEPPAPAPPPPRPPAGSRRPPRRPRVDLRSFYAGGNLAAGIPWQHGVGGDVLVEPLPRFFVAVGYTYFPPARVSTPWLSVLLDRHAPRVDLGGRPWVHRRAELALRAGASLEILRRRSVPGSLPAQTPSRRVVPVLGAGVELRVRLVRRFFAWVGAGADVPLVRPRYLVVPDPADDPVVVTRLDAVRGTFAAGLAVRLGGARKGLTRPAPAGPR